MGSELPHSLALTRRQFVQGAVGALGAPSIVFARDHELVIKKVLVQIALGRRLAPLGPNAHGRPPVQANYAGVEPILRIQTAQGLEGICCYYPWQARSGLLRKLIGLDPFKMFRFDAEQRILGPAESYEPLLAELRGADVALLDLIGQALKRPVASLLGETVREGVMPYDGSLYMDDFLPAEDLKDLVYIKGSTPNEPVELLARKAEWIVHRRPEGYKAIKVKIGRANFMRTPAEALERDVAVTHGIRKAVGADVKILVDANRAYWGEPQMAWNYAEAVSDSNIYLMEEMFPEEDLMNMFEFKKRLSNLGSIKLAAGESNPGGLAENVFTQRYRFWNYGEPSVGEEPLIDVEQADFNSNGFLYLRAKAARQIRLGMTMAPHNSGSKLGFYAQVHLGMVTPNWEASEIDDIEFPALVAEGIELSNGLAKLNGAPGLGVKLRENLLQKPTVEIG
jgi:D-galactarolactone cycloisomerase